LQNSFQLLTIAHMAKSSCFTAKIDVAQWGAKLQADLADQSFELTKPPHTVFSAKKKGVSCTLYESGVVTVQGKEMDAFIEFYLEPEILKEFKFSHPQADLDLTPRMGMDEAGKGDFFGPLCVAAVFADSETISKLKELGVRDSKEMSDKAIFKLASKIRELCPHTVIRLFPLKYNELYGKFKNLNRLLGWAHVAALGDLVQKTGCKKAILDQFANKSVVETFLKQKKLEVDLTQRTKGEEDIVVAAASILARAGFLNGLESLSAEMEIELPKGASKQVVAAAGRLVAKKGPEVLAKVAKTHFKTMGDIDASLS